MAGLMVNNGIEYRVSMKERATNKPVVLNFADKSEALRNRDKYKANRQYANVNISQWISNGNSMIMLSTYVF